MNTTVTISASEQCDRAAHGEDGATAQRERTRVGWAGSGVLHPGLRTREPDSDEAARFGHTAHPCSSLVAAPTARVIAALLLDAWRAPDAPDLAAIARAWGVSARHVERVERAARTTPTAGGCRCLARGCDAICGASWPPEVTWSDYYDALLRVMAIHNRAAARPAPVTREELVARVGYDPRERTVRRTG